MEFENTHYLESGSSYEGPDMQCEISTEPK